MTRPPCKVDGIDCPRRYVGCKSNCSEWHNWLIIHTEEKTTIAKKKYEESVVDGFVADQGRRVRLTGKEGTCKRATKDRR